MGELPGGEIVVYQAPVGEARAAIARLETLGLIVNRPFGGCFSASL
jgi:hypothetical protein